MLSTNSYPVANKENMLYVLEDYGYGPIASNKSYQSYIDGLKNGLRSSRMYDAETGVYTVSHIVMVGA